MTRTSRPVRQPDRRVSALLAGASGVLAALLYGLPARAAGSSMPWEAPLQSILESIEGPVAKIVAVIVIIITGLSLAFGETSGGFRRLIQIVFGLSIAFAASSFFLSFFSFGGGALIKLPASGSIVA
jgi:type IV secretory pathway VirB2 component (pilin)